MMPLVFKGGRISSAAVLQAIVRVWAALNEGAPLPPLGVTTVMQVMVFLGRR